MKKIFWGTVCLICLLIASVSYASATTIDTGKCGDNVSYILDSNGTLTISGTGEMANMVFNMPWGDYSTNIKKVIINKGVTTVGMRAFASCTNLTDVLLPDGLEVLGSGAFIYCSSLENINIPESIITIQPGGTFWGCSSLKSIELPNGITDIGDSTFRDCINLTKINVPSQVISIGTYAFWHCENLTNIELPIGLESIGYGAFRDCSNLSRIDIDDNATTIGQYAFTNCEKLSIYGNEGTYAQEYAISNDIPFNGIVGKGNCGKDDNNVTWSLDVNGTLTISGNGNMANFTRRYSISYGDGSQTITSAPWSSTKSYYKNINNVVIEDGVTSVGDYAFVDLKELEKVTLPDGLEYIGTRAFDGCIQLSDMIMPESVITIKSRAFSDCSSIKKITLGGNIKDINSYVFVGCSSLESINVSNSNQSYCSVDGVLFTKDMTHILTYPVQKNQTSYSIPEGIIDIDAYAFSGNEHLSSIIIPKTVKEIYSDAFLNCTSIKNLTIPGNVERIGDWAFKGCTSLEHVVIEDGVERIGYFYAGYGIGYSFEGCVTLKDIVIPKSIITIDYDAFENCPKLSDVYYGGNKEDFNSLTSLNNPFNNASIHLNSIGKNPPQIVGIPTISENNLNINLTSVEYDSSLITVFSNDNAMVSFKETTILAGDNSKIVTLPDEDIANVKVFIWDSLERMRPLCSAQTLEIN